MRKIYSTEINQSLNYTIGIDRSNVIFHFYDDNDWNNSITINDVKIKDTQNFMWYVVNRLICVVMDKFDVPKNLLRSKIVEGFHEIDWYVRKTQFDSWRWS